MSLTLSSLLLVLLSLFFALNMGGSLLAPAFSAAIGARIIRRWPAVALYTVCVFIGAFLVGGQVAKTLSGGFVPSGTIDRQIALVIIASAGLALTTANIFKIPESTSWVTVFAI